MLVELERQAIECDFVSKVRLPCPSDETNAYDKEHSDESRVTVSMLPVVFKSLPGLRVTSVPILGRHELFHRDIISQVGLFIDQARGVKPG